LIRSLGDVAAGAYPNHIIVVSYLLHDITKLYKLPGLLWERDGREKENSKDGWSAMVVAPVHQEFIHPDMVTKTISAKGDCMYSALVYGFAKMWQTESDVIVLHPKLQDMYKELATCKNLEESIVFMRNFINRGLTPEFLCRHFCDGNWEAYHTFLDDRTILGSGLVDPESDGRFIRSIANMPPSGYVDAIRAYKNSNSYWGRDFDLQMLEMLVGVGVIVFASRSFFGDVVDILGRKPNSPYPFYVTLYNRSNFHFEVASQGRGHVTGYSTARLPAWLRYILEISLCSDLTET